MTAPVFTFQTRIAATDWEAAALDAYAELFGKVERDLFVARRTGRSLNEIKREFLVRHGITGRQFNAVRVGLDGKIDSVKERRVGLISEAQTRIKKAERVIAKLEKKEPGTNKLHQKKRRVATAKARLAAMEADHAAGTVRICFGGRKLFRAQFDLVANGYLAGKDLDDRVARDAAHEAWLADWRHARGCGFFVLGSKDETAGNQSCQAVVSEDGTLSLAVRMPDSLSAHGKRIVLTGVRFAYGHDRILAALRTSRRVEAVTKDGEPIKRLVGTAISYRFIRDDKGWRVFATVEAAPVVRTSSRLIGAIGVDVNADHLAVSETDRHGNLVGARRIPLSLDGKTTDQRKALIGDAVVSIARQARLAGKPVVIERLNFQRKKAELEAVDPTRTRMISSFAYRRFSSSVKAACHRAGVEVIEVNPAYTSVIGAVNHARLKGVSIHMGAALAIARRGLGLSEKPIKRRAVVPVRNGGHVTFELPERNRLRHVWSQWSEIQTHLRAAHAAHYRSGQSREKPAPPPPETRAVGAIRSSTENSRGANRQQHCSAGVMEDVPW